MRGKTVILGVTGSIAAHRAVDLASLLVKDGCSVHVVMTADAQRFVTPLPFKTLSRNAVVSDPDMMWPKDGSQRTLNWRIRRIYY